MAAKRPQRKQSKRKAPAKEKAPEQNSPPKEEPPLKPAPRPPAQLLRKATISEIQSRPELMELYIEWLALPFTQIILDAMWEAVRPVLGPAPEILALTNIMAAYHNQNIGANGVLKRIASLADTAAAQLPSEKANYGATNEWARKQGLIKETE